MNFVQTQRGRCYWNNIGQANKEVGRSQKNTTHPLKNKSCMYDVNNDENYCPLTSNLPLLTISSVLFCICMGKKCIVNIFRNKRKKKIIRPLGYWQKNHLFRATDEVFQQLEDNQVTLSTMKASRYVKAFEAEVRIKCATTFKISDQTEILIRKIKIIDKFFVKATCCKN